MELAADYACGPKEPIQPLLPGDELPGESTKVPRFFLPDEPPVMIPPPTGGGFEIPTELDPLPVPPKDGRDWCDRGPFPADLSGDSGKDPKGQE
jgi:hypothetical protein